MRTMFKKVFSVLAGGFLALLCVGLPVALFRNVFFVWVSGPKYTQGLLMLFVVLVAEAALAVQLVRDLRRPQPAATQEVANG
jgi:hypothetical protein